MGKKDQATNVEYLVRDLSELKIGEPSCSFRTWYWKIPRIADFRFR
jgi:hypothetical protein